MAWYDKYVDPYRPNNRAQPAGAPSAARLNNPCTTCTVVFQSLPVGRNLAQRLFVLLLQVRMNLTMPSPYVLLNLFVLKIITLCL